MIDGQQGAPAFARIAGVLGLITTALVAAPAQALEYELGGVSIAFDTRLSYGADFRVQKQSPALIGPSNGGTNPAAENADDGNLNYSRGIVAHTIKGTHALHVQYSYFGLFTRATYFFDFHNNFKDELSSEAKDAGARRFEMLDAYLSGNYGPVAVRIGWQMINWGEALFTPGGIGAANAVNLQLLRLPGSEFREAFIPSPMAWASWEIGGGLSVEGYYTALFKRNRLEACGTYFSTSDLLCEGGPSPLIVDSPFGPLELPRTDDFAPEDWQEFGAALRYYAPRLNGAELALYYLQHHSRSPFISAVSAAPLPNYAAEYPDTIRLLGFSFNTEVFGLALQGEYAHRFNAPLALDSVAAFTPAFTAPPGERFAGFDRFQVGQYALNVSYNFASFNPFFAQNMFLMGEVAASVVYNPPEAGEVQLQGPTGVPDNFAMGYRLQLSVEYFSVIGSIGLNPTVTFAHDPFGTSPLGGNFVEGRTALTVGVAATYLNAFALELSYSGFYGSAGGGNLLYDRDLVGFTLRYFL